MDSTRVKTFSIFYNISLQSDIFDSVLWNGMKKTQMFDLTDTPLNLELRHEQVQTIL